MTIRSWGTAMKLHALMGSSDTEAEVAHAGESTPSAVAPGKAVACAEAEALRISGCQLEG